MNDAVNKPSHYTFSKIEVLDAIEEWGLEYHEGNVVKYIARAKHKNDRLEDLKKAKVYLERKIHMLEGCDLEATNCDYKHGQTKKVYLACPYSHEKEWVRQNRANDADEFAAFLMEQGYVVFSPISHSHYIADYLPETMNSYNHWIHQDEYFVDWADEVHVLCIDGWEKSAGVRHEISLAEKQGKPVVYRTMDEIDDVLWRER